MFSVGANSFGIDIKPNMMAALKELFGCLEYKKNISFYYHVRGYNWELYSLIVPLVFH